MSQLQTILDKLAPFVDTDDGCVNVEIMNAMAIIYQMMQAEPVPVPDDIVAGALYDFLGYLTTRRTRITMSDRDEAGPAVDALVDWSKARKINLVEARVRDWNVFTAPQAVPAKKCKYSDPLCPCQDGHQCHYEGKDAWTAPQAVPAGWLPIESAPKPSGRVLLAAEGQTCYGHWYSLAEPPRWEYDGYACGNPKTQPTHWMKLP